MPPPRNGPSRTSRTGTASRVFLLLAFLSAASAATTSTSTSTSTSTAATPTITLPSQILQVVPACAIDCLATFVQTNFQGFKKDATACPGTTPSFACLCEHTGANGFTLGEAAISCLTLEAGAGRCTSTGKFADAFADVKRAAYLMCPSAAASDSFTAAEQTHRTIVATAVVGSEFALNDADTTTTTTVTARPKTSTHHGFSTITTGTLTSTSSSSSSTTKSTSTSKAQTLTISASSLPTTLITAPPTASRSTTTSAASATPSPATTSSSTTGNDTSSSSPKPPLSTGQIVGISVGAAVGLIAAVCLYFGLTWLSKRRERDSGFFGDTGAFPGQSGQTGPTGGGSPKKDTTGFTRLPELNFNTVSSTASTRNDTNNNGHEMQISAPMHLQQPLRYQSQQPAFVSPWQEKQETPQTRNPYAQQTPYTMPTIRPVNNTPSLMTNTRQDYSQPAPARVLTAKTLPSRPSQAESSQSQSQPSQPQLYSQPPQSYTRPQYQPAQPQNNYNYSRPALPADWRPRPPQQQQQQPQRRQLPPLQPPYPASLQTMAEEDEGEDEEYETTSRPPLPPKSQAIFGPPVPNRDSVVTEFAEDGEDEYSLRTSGRVSGRTSRRRESGGQNRQTQYSAAAGNPYDEYMSPTLVPRPLAAQRVGDDRPPALKLGASRPRQNWQRMNSVIL